MVVDSILPHAECGLNDYRKDAPPFIGWEQRFAQFRAFWLHRARPFSIKNFNFARVRSFLAHNGSKFVKIFDKIRLILVVICRFFIFICCDWTGINCNKMINFIFFQWQSVCVGSTPKIENIPDLYTNGVDTRNKLKRKFAESSFLPKTQTPFYVPVGNPPR